MPLILYIKKLINILIEKNDTRNFKYIYSLIYRRIYIVTVTVVNIVYRYVHSIYTSFMYCIIVTKSCFIYYTMITNQITPLRCTSAYVLLPY